MNNTSTHAGSGMTFVGAEKHAEVTWLFRGDVTDDVIIRRCDVGRRGVTLVDVQASDVHIKTDKLLI